jgi:hypothetical protein
MVMFSLLQLYLNIYLNQYLITDMKNVNMISNLNWTRSSMLERTTYLEMNKTEFWSVNSE